MNFDKQITMYGKTDCNYCTRAHTLLRMKELPYTYISTDTSEDLKQKVRDLWMTVGNARPTLPLILIDGKIIGGYTELEQLILNNNL